MRLESVPFRRIRLFLVLIGLAGSTVIAFAIVSGQSAHAERPESGPLTAIEEFLAGLAAGTNVVGDFNEQGFATVYLDPGDTNFRAIWGEYRRLINPAAPKEPSAPQLGHGSSESFGLTEIQTFVSCSPGQGAFAQGWVFPGSGTDFAFFVDDFGSRST